MSNNPVRYTDPTGHMLEEGGGSCGANNHTCWQNSAKAWEHASQTIDKKAFGGYQQLYFAAQASLAYNIADGAPQDVIQASVIHIEDAYRGLLTNGYAGQKIGVSTAFDSSGFEALGLATLGVNLAGMFVPTGMTLSPDGVGGGGGSGTGDVKLSGGYLKMLEKQILADGYQSIEDLKVPGGKGAGGYDLYVQPNGDIVIKPKSGIGPGEPTGYNINDL